MPRQELCCSGILKTLFSFFEALHSCNEFIPFFVGQFTDLGGDAGGRGFFCECFRGDASGFRHFRGFYCACACLFAGAVSSDVALFVTFEAATFLPIFLFVCFGDGFLGSCTSIHCVWISRWKLLYQWLSRVLWPLVLLLSSTSSPKEGVVSGILHRGRSGCSRSILGLFKALNQDIIPLLCLCCLCPLLKALGLF